MSTSPPLSQADTDMLRSLQGLRDFILVENFSDGTEWVGVIDRVISRTRGDRWHKRHAKIRRVAPGKPQRLVTMLD